MTRRKLLGLVEQIVSLPTAPYHETAVKECLQAWARKLRVDMKEDKYGNLLVRYRHSAARKRVAFAAHTDHPGFEITGWRSPQIARAVFLGGVSRGYFRKGTAVILFSRAGAKLARAQIARVVDWEKKVVELRVTGRTDVPRGQAVFGMWDLPPFVRRGNLLHARVCDDLMGVAALCALLEQLARGRVRADVTAVFTRAEEVGFAGALGLTRSKLLPTGVTVISIENSQALPDTPVGGGAVVRVGDRSSVFDPGVTAELTALAGQMSAKNKKFFYQRRLMHGGSCEGTVYQMSGYRTGALCLPMGNYHNMSKKSKIACEYVDLRDLEGLIALMSGYARAVGTQVAGQKLKKRLDEIWASGKRKLLNPKN